ncbi:hypothetical protein SAY87_000236 [Trapa incisa]|uniref:Peptidase A1 domain-containing protein n=1 Tax=Trapa incisa TaxID=236973 RepID=A0AAN7GBE2_9MYRT|nr:hypothetical protein SAY87_000236 [Trapa incisa]
MRCSSILLLFLLTFVVDFQVCRSDFSRIQERTPAGPSLGSIVLPVSGNVYPLGYYTVSLSVGQPPKLYDLDLDTGSDLTWLQCDAPCTGCTKPRDQQYKPKNNLVHCKDPLCTAIRTPSTHPCTTALQQCDYEIEYADGGSSIGVLVKDSFTIRLTNNTRLSPQLAFGCGYNQHSPGPASPPPTSGILGLGNGKAGIVSQLVSFGVMRHVLGHCLSTKGGGFLFLGAGPVPSSNIKWAPMSPHTSLEKHYSSGPAELLIDRKPSSVKGLQVIFDSGSSYTYFNSRAYKAVLDQLRAGLKGKPFKDATEDKSLPVCWRGAQPSKAVDDVKQYFKPLVLRFRKDVQYEILPAAYLVITTSTRSSSPLL